MQHQASKSLQGNPLSLRLWPLSIVFMNETDSAGHISFCKDNEIVQKIVYFCHISNNVDKINGLLTMSNWC